MTTRVFEYEIFNDSMKELINSISNFKKVHIVSGNPEVLLSGLKNPEMLKNFTSGNSIIIPDGISTVIC